MLRGLLRSRPKDNKENSKKEQQSSLETDWTDVGSEPSSQKQQHTSAEAQDKTRKLPKPPGTRSERDRAASVIQRAYRRMQFISIVTKVASDCRRRHKIVQEILSTERDYVGQLESLFKVFIIPLNEQAILNPAEVNALCPHLEHLYLLHASFLPELSERVSGWNAHSYIGDLFAKLVVERHEEFIESYRNYVSRFPEIQKASTLFYNEKKKYKAFVDAQVSKTMGKGKLFMESLQIVVVQRLPRYELLMRDLFRVTMPDSPDKRYLDVVLQGLKIVSHMVDSSVGIGDDRHTWEPSSFSTFRWCAVCQTMLRGRGISCSVCNITVHPRCQFSTPIQCIKPTAVVQENSQEKLERVRALYDCVPDDAGELAFKAGDVITVLERYPDQWCKGELQGKIGLFPANYVVGTY